MSTFNEGLSVRNPSEGEPLVPQAPVQQSSTLRKDVERAMSQYFANLGDETVTDLYQLVLNEVEVPLLEAALRHSGSNQSKASIMLGLNRGTLRKKLKQHGML